MDEVTLIEMIQKSDPPKLPKKLEPAVKFVNPDFTTHGGFAGWFKRGWVASPDETFNPTTCEPGGLHVADTFSAAQSGGAKPSHCLWVGVDPAEAGSWEDGKRKAPRVYVAGPIDLIGIIRRFGFGADLSGADLSGAYLFGADLSGAYLFGAYGRDDWDDLVKRGAICGWSNPESQCGIAQRVSSLWWHRLGGRLRSWPSPHGGSCR